MQSDLKSLLEMANALFADANEAHIRQNTDREERQFFRRAYVRALFAYFEGTCFLMRQYALFKMKNNRLDHRDILTIAALKEESVTVDDKGEPCAQKLRTPFRNNLVLSFQALSHVDGIPFKFNKSSEGYQAFDQSIRIRDRITHPRSKSNLEITDKEMKHIEVGSKWFLNLLESLLQNETPHNPPH